MFLDSRFFKVTDTFKVLNSFWNFGCKWFIFENAIAELILMHMRIYFDMGLHNMNSYFNHHNAFRFESIKYTCMTQTLSEYARIFHEVSELKRNEMRLMEAERDGEECWERLQ